MSTVFFLRFASAFMPVVFHKRGAWLEVENVGALSFHTGSRVCVCMCYENIIKYTCSTMQCICSYCRKQMKNLSAAQHLKPQASQGHSGIGSDIGWLGQMTVPRSFPWTILHSIAGDHWAELVRYHLQYCLRRVRTTCLMRLKKRRLGAITCVRHHEACRKEIQNQSSKTVSSYLQHLIQTPVML